SPSLPMPLARAAAANRQTCKNKGPVHRGGVPALADLAIRQRPAQATLLATFFDFFAAALPFTNCAWNTGCFGASRPVSFLQVFLSSAMVPPKLKSFGLPRFFASFARSASVA